MTLMKPPLTTGSQMTAAREIREQGADLERLLHMLGASPELAQAKLRLELSLMWAGKHPMKY